METKTSNQNRLIWVNGEIMPVNQANINVLSPTSQFGANVFEGIRCYWNESQQQLYAFKLKEHYKRLQNSVKMMRFEKKYENEDLQRGLVEVVKANHYKEDIAVRQTIFLDGFGSWSSRGPVGMFIAPIPKSRLNSDVKGIRCCVSSWERINDKNLSPHIKVGANYINSRMAQLEAIENGYDSTIFLNHQGKVSEGPGSCLFIVRDGTLITAPLSASVLDSITRQTLLELAEKELNIKIEVREIDRTELYIADEVFLCGSAMEVMPVLSVDGISIANGIKGEITQNLHEIYLSVACGQISQYKMWLTPIYE